MKKVLFLLLITLSSAHAEGELTIALVNSFGELAGSFTLAAEEAATYTGPRIIRVGLLEFGEGALTEAGAAEFELQILGSGSTDLATTELSIAERSALSRALSNPATKVTLRRQAARVVVTMAGSAFVFVAVSGILVLASDRLMNGNFIWTHLSDMGGLTLTQGLQASLGTEISTALGLGELDTNRAAPPPRNDRIYTPAELQMLCREELLTSRVYALGFLSEYLGRIDEIGAGDLQPRDGVVGVTDLQAALGYFTGNERRALEFLLADNELFQLLARADGIIGIDDVFSAQLWLSACPPKPF